jgi:2-polyprenyl-3-methyl-5-hydroxy-6-metoxy-1,4-benzoquinol methylase
MILSRLRSMAAALAGPSAHWSGDAIKDAWFDAHFHHAANAVAEWVGEDRIRNGRLLDFGCGDGITMLALVLRYQARRAMGVDVSCTHAGLAELARREIGLRRLPPNLAFQRIVAGERIVSEAPFDVIMSWSTFEHVDLRYLDGILRNLHDLLAPDGVFFLQISPLFHSPQGSHLGRFQLPDWAHLLWSREQLEQAVMAFQGELPTDEIEENFHTRDFASYKRFVLKEYDELNRLTGAELIQRLAANGFEVVRHDDGKVRKQPPPELLARYALDDLQNEEILLLLRKKAV